MKRMTKSLLAALALASVLVLGACGYGDDNETTPTPTESVSQTPASSPTTAPTSTPTAGPAVPTPTPEPGVGEDPDPNSPSEGGDGTVVAPVLPDGVSEVTIGTLQLQLQPGAIVEVDPVHVAMNDVGAAPVCAALAATWTWSGEPANGSTGLTVDAIRQGGGEQVGTGPSGAADTGCMLLRFRNGGDEQITVQVNYAIGEYGG